MHSWRTEAPDAMSSGSYRLVRGCACPHTVRGALGMGALAVFEGIWLCERRSPSERRKIRKTIGEHSNSRIFAEQRSTERNHPSQPACARALERSSRLFFWTGGGNRDICRTEIPARLSLALNVNLYETQSLDRSITLSQTMSPSINTRQGSVRPHGSQASRLSSMDET